MRGIASYKSVAMESSDQRKLVVMCFEALIRRQEQAKQDLEDQKFVDANEHLRVSREIYCELLLALDEEPSPDLTANRARFPAAASGYRFQNSGSTQRC